MNEVDDAVLEFFAAQEEGVAMTPAVVWYNLHELLEATDKSKETIARRMRNLPDRGLLENVDEHLGYYRITEKGRAYLAGEIDADAIRLPGESA